jgi:hypothetical protein
MTGGLVADMTARCCAEPASQERFRALPRPRGQILAARS